ncbi:MAG: hypothetical protein AMJ69_12425 [Gammaproteobacteria bacterium SG8_47]|nr:MAG: hypothetical protein AMJ69_12425 [Gammaproteobacteria bacterium SG8_47]
MEPSSNHFKLFGLEIGFDIDEQLLAQRYRELQRTAHPDRYVSATDRERRLAVQRAAEINDAFQILREPLSRARYLLELNGVGWDAERNTATDPAFLMEQMELRETLHEARAAREPLPSIDRLLADISERVGGAMAELRELFAAEAPDFERIKVNIDKQQFLRRLQRQAEELEEELLGAA